MSFHTLLNGTIGLFGVSFSAPAWLLPSRRQAEICGKKSVPHVHLFSV